MSRNRVLGGRIDEIDVQIERIHRLIDSAAREDPELASGMATGETLASVQRKLDQASAGCEAVDQAIRDAARNRENGNTRRRR